MLMKEDVPRVGVTNKSQPAWGPFPSLLNRSKYGLRKGDPRVIFIRGERHSVCARSFWIFDVDGTIRRNALRLVHSAYFDWFILLLIVLGSICEAAYQYRQDCDRGFNYFVRGPLDWVLTTFFTIELVLKVIAWGLFFDEGSYLRDPWNWLDVTVVVTSLIGIARGSSCEGGGLGFLRVFRVLRPLRSLSSIPKMKMLVNTALSALPKLNFVIVAALFLFLIFGIIGINLLEGIFYRRCHEGINSRPAISSQADGTRCWTWPYVDADTESRLCGGRYMCEDSGGTCGGHELDPDESLRPQFDGGKQDLPWCPGSEPARLIPETDFIHFDHLGGALLALFQSMTLEGWTEIMYWVQDSYNVAFSTFYFAAVVMVTSWFTLNVALAVVDEARDEFYQKEEAPAAAPPPPAAPEGEEEREELPEAPATTSEQVEQLVADPEKPRLWWNTPVVKAVHTLSQSCFFQHAVMFFIISNVITMSLTTHPPQMYLLEFLAVCEVIFLIAFTVEMAIMVTALGPVGYLKDPTTRFDGLIMLTSYIEMAFSGGSALRALRTVRLFRVIGRLANRSALIRILLRSIANTVLALNYWMVLFVIVLYIFTLMSMSLFATNFHFTDPDTFEATADTRGQAWCGNHHLSWNLRQDCIPRAHFDTFLWAFITVFQIMTGENWNTVMYAGMRAGDPHPNGGWIMAAFFVFVIFFGQILFLSLFLSMLLSTFEEEQARERAREQRWSRNFSEKNARLKATVHYTASSFVAGVLRLGGRAPRGAEEEEEGLACAEHPVVELGQAFDTPSSSSSCGGRTRARPATGEGRSGTRGGDRQDFSEALGVVPCGDASCTGPSRGTPFEVTETSIESFQSVGDDVQARPQHSPESVMRQASVMFQAFSWDSDNLTLPGQMDDVRGSVGQGAPASEAGSFDPASGSWSRSGPMLHVPEPPCDSMDVIELATGREVPPPPDRGLDGGCRNQAVPADVFGLQIVPAPAEPLAAAQRAPQPPTAPWSCCRNSLLIFPPESPVRQACQFLLNAQVTWERTPPHEPTRVKVFDNFILSCIAMSTCVMAIDTPLRDPSDSFTQVLRVADMIFAFVFILEMLIKLVAMGVFGKEGYLSSAWNWLDGCVVAVSVASLFSSSGGVSGLSTLRILRAFRPLRIISRNEGLKKVVNTIANSLPELGMVALLALMVIAICALLTLTLLHGKLYYCDGEDAVSYLRDGAVVAPLCLGADALDNIGALARGPFSREANAWSGSDASCPGSRPVPWQRASADTPICISRCNAHEQASNATLCPPPFQSTAELPPVASCSSSRSWTAAELRGQEYVDSMTRLLVLPCGGYTLDEEADQVVMRSNVASCAAAFCPDADLASTNCVEECKAHPYWCKDSCPPGEPTSKRCEACRRECEAQCSCPAFCQPLMKDGALCAEQGYQWVQVVSQDFNNFLTSTVTLFEISTTEGWVDVMYAAVDSQDWFVQPLRDSNEWLWGVFFVVYIFTFSMFVLNLAVGVVVTQFLALKKQYQDRHKEDGFFITPAQQKLKTYLRTLLHNPMPWTFTRLGRLSPGRRRVFDLVSTESFDNFIMACILANSVVMCIKTFPETVDERYLRSIGVVFVVIFTFEFVLKFYAMRWEYFKEYWNRFDFVSVATSICGILLTLSHGINVASVTAVVRIVRIVRVFRLLRMKSFQGLRKIFSALILSVPKLINVFMILALFLILYSILGVSLFSTTKANGDALNHHGNFVSLPWAFVTLFRATTGEAWNEIMHDLGRSQEDFFAAGDWCTPADLFDTFNKWDDLNDKCLIDHPNSCVNPLFGRWNIWPTLYWVSYTLIVALVIMNLVIAVILEGYEDCSRLPPEKQILEVCKDHWKRHDRERELFLPIPTVLCFIRECLDEVAAQREAQPADGGAAVVRLMSTRVPASAAQMRRMPMAHASILHNIEVKDGMVSWAMASRQVLMLCGLAETVDGEDFDETEAGRKIADFNDTVMGRTVSERAKSALGSDPNCQPLVQHIAATRIQSVLKGRNSRRRCSLRLREGMAERPPEPGSQAESKGDAAPAPSVAEEAGRELTPRPAG